MSDQTTTVGVLVLSYGSPASLDEVEPYYTDIRRGRPPSAEQLSELVARYQAIGGTTRLAEYSAGQLAALQASLVDISRAAGQSMQFVVEAGHKHSLPSIESGFDALVDRGADAVVGVVLAPHYSKASIGTYLQRCVARSESTTVPFAGIERWWDLPEFVEFGARSVRTALDGRTDRALVLFTAHSLPIRVLESDPYREELHRSAQLVAEAAGLDRWAEWSCAWQSAGRTAEPWVGPDVLEVITMAADTGRADSIVVYPHGFTSDHLEVAYDLDIEAAAAAERVGLGFARCAVVSADATVMGALARRIADVAVDLTGHTG